MVEAIDVHPSEIEQDSIKVDYTIENNDSIEELIKKVKQIMIKEGVINK
jgi:hypothetical protein